MYRASFGVVKKIKRVKNLLHNLKNVIKLKVYFDCSCSNEIIIIVPWKSNDILITNKSNSNYLKVWFSTILQEKDEKYFRIKSQQVTHEESKDQEATSSKVESTNKGFEMDERM